MERFRDKEILVPYPVIEKIRRRIEARLVYYPQPVNKTNKFWQDSGTDPSKAYLLGRYDGLQDALRLID